MLVTRCACSTSFISLLTYSCCLSLLRNVVIDMNVFRSSRLVPRLERRSLMSAVWNNWWSTHRRGPLQPR